MTNLFTEQGAVGSKINLTRIAVSRILQDAPSVAEDPQMILARDTILAMLRVMRDRLAELAGDDDGDTQEVKPR